MKTKSLFLTAVAFVALCCGCKKETTDDIVSVSFSSFGFYAEDNSGVLNGDFIEENPTSTKLNFTLPFGTEEDGLKSLIARFSVTEGASVYLADASGNPTGAPIISGKTAVDYSSDISLIIALDNNYKAYSVSVKIAEPAKWKQVAMSENNMKESPVLTINRKDGQPYITGTVSDEAHDGWPVLLKYDGSSLQNVAGGYLVENAASHMALDFSPEGTPFVTMLDKSVSKQTVVKISNGDVSYVGDKNALFSSTGSSNSASAVFPLSDNDIWCAHCNNDKSFTFGRRTLDLAHFDGNSWQSGLTIPGRADKDLSYNITGKFIGGVPYLFIYNQNTQSVSLYKYSDSSWSAILESKTIKKSDGKTDATLNLRAFDFDVADNGAVYVLTAADFITEKVYNAGLVMINPANDSQVIIGGVMNNVDISVARSMSLALDSNGTPYIAVTLGELNSRSAYIMHVDYKTKTWSEPELLYANAEYVTIRFAEDGTGYVVVHEDSDTSNKYVLFASAE